MGWDMHPLETNIRPQREGSCQRTQNTEKKRLRGTHKLAKEKGGEGVLVGRYAWQNGCRCRGEEGTAGRRETNKSSCWSRVVFELDQQPWLAARVRATRCSKSHASCMAPRKSGPPFCQAFVRFSISFCLTSRPPQVVQARSCQCGPGQRRPLPPSPQPLTPPPQVYELTSPPPSSIATASPDPSEATEAKPISNSRRTKEQADISSTRNGDASPTTKLERARIHCNVHKKPDNSIKGKPVCDDTEGADIIKNTSADTLNPDAAISIARTTRAADSSNNSNPVLPTTTTTTAATITSTRLTPEVSTSASATSCTIQAVTASIPRTAHRATTTTVPAPAATCPAPLTFTTASTATRHKAGSPCQRFYCYAATQPVAGSLTH